MVLSLEQIYLKVSNCCHLCKSHISIINTNTTNTREEGFYSLPQSTREPITVIMVSSGGGTLMTAPTGSSECHLIKAMILFLPQQQHKYPHFRPCLPSIILEWCISDDNFLLFPATQPVQGKVPTVDDYLAMPIKIIRELDTPLESPEF